MSENGKTIKVVDRRLFTADGEVREEVKAELEAPDPTPAAVPAEPRPEPAAEARTASDPAFLRLLDMLAQTAAMYLGGMPDPVTGRPQVDVAGARQIVDSILALREKTRGKLSFEESDVLESLVGELQLTVTRLTAPPPPRRGPAPTPARRG